MRPPLKIDAWDKCPSECSALEIDGRKRGVSDFSVLEGLSCLKVLRVHHLNDKQLKILPGLSSLEELSLLSPKVLDFYALEALIGLRDLAVYDSRVESLAGIERLRNLEDLSLEHLPRIKSAEPLKSLVKLRRLRIATLPSWDGKKKLVLESFKPFSSLTLLESLQLVGISCADKSLRPLGDLQRLRRLDLANCFAIEEFAFLAWRLKDVVTPFSVVGVLTCKTCGLQKVMLRGKRAGKKTRTVLCQKCDAEKIQKHVQLFEELRHHYERAKQ